MVNRPGSLRPGGRTARTRAAVMQAVVGELIDNGYAGTTVERVAARAEHQMPGPEEALYAELAVDNAMVESLTKATSGKVNIVADNGKLANVFVYVKDGLGDRTFDVPKDAVTLDQKGCQYHPHVLGVMTGQNIEIKNDDPTTHNIHPSPNNNREWNMTQPHGMPLERTFAREEIAIPVKCNVHPWMRGYIAVFKHPYFAVTDKNGDFELKDVPPGTYTITAWQEKLGTQTQKVTIGANEAKAVDFAFKQ